MIDRIAERLLDAVGLGFDLELDWNEEGIHAITEHLHLGRRPVPEDLGHLEEVGITDVVSCLPPDSRDSVAWLDPHFATHFLPLRDSVHQDIQSCFATFTDLLERVSTSGGRLLVHCEAGVSRSATLAIASLMTARDLRFYEAFVEVRRRRPQVLPNIGFASQLYALERSRHAPLPGQPTSLGRYLREACNAPVDTELLETVLADHDHDAFAALAALFAGEIPRVVQGVRV